MRLSFILRCGVCVLLAVVLSGCSKETLLRELTEVDANEIVGALYSSSIEAQKVSDAKGKSFAVEVLSSDLPRSVAVLRALGLPKSPRANLNEVFRSTGFAPTPFEERVRYLFGLAQELERTVSLMEGVLQTRVHVVTPDNAAKRGDVQQSKASVYVSYDDRYDIEVFVPRIRKLVSDAIEGLAPNRVEILAIPSRVDLKAASEVPIKRVMGVRVHKNDANLLLIEVGVILGLLVMSTGLHISALWRRRPRQRAAPVGPLAERGATVAASPRSARATA
jgi:type III secretion protein J